MKGSFASLYERHREAIISVQKRCMANGGEFYGPYLIEPHDSYIQAPYRVVFVGQETVHWWTSECDIEHQLKCYRDFNLNGHADGSRHPGAYWNLIRTLEKGILGNTHACAALNLNRFSQNGRRPSWQNQQIMAEIDFLLLEELALLQPDLVIFFTGPNYDLRLETLLKTPWASVPGFPVRQLACMNPALLGCPAYRTYHPTYLRRRRLEKTVISFFTRVRHPSALSALRHS